MEHNILMQVFKNLQFWSLLETRKSKLTPMPNFHFLWTNLLFFIKNFNLKSFTTSPSWIFKFLHDIWRCLWSLVCFLDWEFLVKSQLRINGKHFFPLGQCDHIFCCRNNFPSHLFHLPMFITCPFTTFQVKHWPNA